MAEKFTLPKAFTKEWFSYVWDYYKYHILICIAVIVLAVYTIVEISTAVKYDANINFVSSSVIEQESTDSIADACEIACSDLDGNNEVNISFSQLNFTEEATKDAALHSALINKLMATFATEDEYIYIVDKNMMDYIINMESTEELFVPINQWAGTKSADDVFGMPLTNSSVLKSVGVDVSDKYIMIRECYNTEDEGLQLKQENAINIAKFLIK